MTLHGDIGPGGRKRRQKVQQVFDFVNAHARREFVDIDKYSLSVPIQDYQRDESEGRVASEVAMHFDSVAFGALLVIKRSNGELVVADGGTRLAGARRRPDVSTVPCLVFSGLTEQEEGDVFLRVNCNRRKLRTEQQHHAELFSDHDLALHTQRLIDNMVANGTGFDSLSTMRACVKSNRTAINVIVGILLQVAKDKHVTARVMKGLFRLETILNKHDKTLNRKPTIRRMLDSFGSLDAVVNAMVKPRTGGSTLEMARAIARTLRVKFPIKE